MNVEIAEQMLGLGIVGVDEALDVTVAVGQERLDLSSCCT